MQENEAAVGSNFNPSANDPDRIGLIPRSSVERDERLETPPPILATLEWTSTHGIDCDGVAWRAGCGPGPRRRGRIERRGPRLLLRALHSGLAAGRHAERNSKGDKDRIGDHVEPRPNGVRLRCGAT